MEREKRGIWSRRDFFSRIGWGGFAVFGGLSLLGFLRSAFPRVLFQPPSTFKAGFPADYAPGEVSDKFKQDYRVWIVREDEGVYALFAKCTHLGSTPNCSRQKTNSNVVATEAVITRAKLTSKARHPVRWIDFKSLLPEMAN